MTDQGVVSAVALLCAFVVTVFISIGIAFLVLYFVGMWRLYKKLGLEGWESLIPFYGKWMLFKQLKLNWYWFLIYYAPLFYLFYIDKASAIGYTAYFVASLVYIYNISKKFHKPNSWIVITFIFPFVSLPLLGLITEKDADDTVSLTPNAMFDDKKDNKVVSKVKKVSKKIEKAVEEKKKAKEDK